MIEVKFSYFECGEFEYYDNSYVIAWTELSEPYKEKIMDYLEAREIVDKVLSGEMEVNAEDRLGWLIDYLEKMVGTGKDAIEKKEKLIEKYLEGKSPEIIVNMKRFELAEKKGEVKEREDLLNILKCMAALPDLCAYDVYNTYRCSQRKGCEDCRYRVAKFDKEKSFSTDDMYCALRAGLTDGEKESYKDGYSIYNPETGESREATEEELKKVIEGTRPLFEGYKYNTPCECYSPSPEPFFMCLQNKKGIEVMKNFAKDNPPKDEYFDEDDLYAEMLFCKKNLNRFSDAANKLLDAIFGRDEEEKENNEDNA